MIIGKQGFHITATKHSWVKNEMLECATSVVLEFGVCVNMPPSVDQRFNSTKLMVMSLDP